MSEIDIFKHKCKKAKRREKLEPKPTKDLKLLGEILFELTKESLERVKKKRR